MVYLFLAEGFEEIEALCPIDMLRRAGIDVKSVSITDNKCVVGAHGIATVADITFDEVDISQVDMLILPGGMPGTKNLLAHSPLVSMLKVFGGAGGEIAAICAAPMVLGRIGLLEGKRATCYPGFEGELAGATYTTDKVVVDQNVITAQGMGVAIEFSCAIIDKLLGNGHAAPIKESIRMA